MIKKIVLKMVATRGLGITHIDSITSDSLENDIFKFPYKHPFYGYVE